MRTYPRNSPQAAARVVAVAMLADGHVCKSEVDVLDRFDAGMQLGLSRSEMQSVLHAFCEDLLSFTHLGWSAGCRIDPVMLYDIMSEIDDPALCRKVLALCVSVVEADRHVADAESAVLVAAARYWRLDPSAPPNAADARPEHA